MEESLQTSHKLWESTHNLCSRFLTQATMPCRAKLCVRGGWVAQSFGPGCHKRRSTGRRHRVTCCNVGVVVVVEPPTPPPRPAELPPSWPTLTRRKALPAGNHDGASFLAPTRVVCRHRGPKGLRGVPECVTIPPPGACASQTCGSCCDAPAAAAGLRSLAI